MIKYQLQCQECTHAFEAWFRSSDSFDALAAAGEVACAACGGAKVEKAIMAPRLAHSGSEKSAPADAHKTVMVARKAREAMLELRRKVESNCDYVGEKFPEEARRIHYGETEERGIYGEADKEEHDALRDEGIEVQRIPWVDRTEH
ncbi:MAG: DUF1178 family protein [Alphaproteobacteria bacterium]|nr:DUF1178 family protein [Alphaproteobacteria bacterium]